MSSFSLGDLAQTFMLQRQGAALKANMTRLNEELATGQVSDVKSVLAGNTSYLSDIERDLKTLSGFRVATTEAAQYAESIQLSLERVSDSSESFGTSLLKISSNATGSVLDQFSDDAESQLANIVGVLNTSVGGRSLFAGDATNQRPMADAEVILDGLRAATAGAATPQDLRTAAEIWFNDPAGCVATAYTGSATEIAPLRIGQNEKVSVQIKGDDPIFKDIIKQYALAAITGDAAFSFSATDRQELLAEAGRSLFSTQTDMTALRAKIGSAQARIDEVGARNATEQTSLQFAKGALLQADPYETATELEAVQFQLQSLYTVTARMSDLSFVNFVR